VAEEFTVSRTAVGAACAIFDDRDHVLLVHHTYGHLNWELPGGLGEEGEAPDETALRELREETGLRAELERLTGVYLEPNHDFGPMLHFVFRSRWHDRLDPVVSSPEISELRYWPLDDLPRPISDFTERRIRDALVEQPVQVGRVDSRRWRE
jgi:ADP-ribose pyrophosphatase YjhB (NUDIX family)